MKKFWIFLVSALMVAVSVFSIVGCNKQNVLSNYLLPENEALVEADFTLPSEINGSGVTWTSNNTDAITIEKGTGEYTAKVTLGDEVKTVTLTVSCGKESKKFNVNVRALDVSYFVKQFESNGGLPQYMGIVYEDFDLRDESFEYNGKKATITWAVDDKGGQEGDYLTIAKEGGKTVCKVTQSTVDREVRLYATFTYNEQTQKPNYRMTVSYQRTHEELVDYWYNNTGVSVDMSGYVVAIGTEYSSSYGNVTLYMVDDDYCTGYYLYRVKLKNASDGALLVPGAHVTVTSTTNTNYNGLIETNAGGSLVVDSDKSITKEALYEHVYALDDDLLAGSPEAKYHTSTLVSLSGWKVTGKASSKPTDYKGATLFTLEKGGVKITVGLSTYLEGAYKNKDDETFKAICNLYDTINVDDYVNVEGILGNYNGYQILPLSADKVTKADAEEAVPEYAAPVSAAIAKVQGIFKTAGITSTAKDTYGNYNKVSGYTVVASKTVEAPTNEGDVTIKYELLHASSSVAGTKYSDADALANKAYGLIENGNIAITVGEEDMACIRVTYTCGTYSTYTYHTVHTKSMNPAQVVANIQYSYKLPATQTAVDDVKLDNTYAQYPGSEISWEIVGEDTGAEIVTAEVEGKTTYTLHVATANTTAEDKVIKLKATFKYGEGEAQKTATKTYDFTLLKVTAVETGTFKLALEQANLNKKLYFKGEINGSNFGVTTESYFEAADVVIAEATVNEIPGYSIKVGEKFLELNASNRLTLVDTATGVWKYNYAANVFTWTIGTKIYYLGTYGTYDTISASETWRITDDPSVVGKTQFVAFYEKAVEYTDEQKGELALNGLTIPASVTKNLELTTTVPGVTLSIKASTNTAAIALDGTVTRGSKDVTGITLTIAASVGGTEVATKDFTNLTVPKTNNTGETVTLSFANVTADSGSAITDGDCTARILELVGSDKGLVSASVVKGYEGSGNSGSNGQVVNTSGCLKFGTSSAKGVLTLTFDKAVTKVVINARGWGATDKISITDNGTDATATTLSAAQELGTTAADKTFDLDKESDVISIVTDKRVIIFSIEVTFAA